MTRAAIEKQTNLKQRWADFRAAHPTVRIRDAAQRLGVSEAELLAADAGDSIVRLNGNFAELLQELHTLRRVMALTRNEAVVHERKGEYRAVEVFGGHGKMGLVLGDDIDLRIFFNNWHFGFAVVTDKPGGVLRSFQFFDGAGTAVHKVFLTDTSDLAAYENLTAKYRSDAPPAKLKIKRKAEISSEKPDAEIDVSGFQKAWAEMQDTHDFFGMIRKFGLSRRQALRLASREMAFQVPMDSYKCVLKQASETKLPIMVFVGNDGIIQIHTGAVENVVAAHGWFNILDERFNLHINEAEIAAAWVVKKPTADGVVSSLEIYNRAGENVALFFGKRKPGIPEKEEWCALLNTIEKI